MLFNSYIYQVKFQTLMHIIIIWKICLNPDFFHLAQVSVDMSGGDGPVICTFLARLRYDDVAVGPGTIQKHSSPI